MRERKFGRLIAKLAWLNWRPVFHRRLDNPSAPGGKVDMWLMVDDDSGEGIVSIGCPPNRPDIPAYTADCCMNPWMAVPDDGASMIELAVKFNQTIIQHYGEGNDAACDAKEIAIACKTVLAAYVKEVPEKSRVELVNSISARLQPLREGRIG